MASELVNHGRLSNSLVNSARSFGADSGPFGLASPSPTCARRLPAGTDRSRAGLFAATILVVGAVMGASPTERQLNPPDRSHYPHTTARCAQTTTRPRPHRRRARAGLRRRGCSGTPITGTRYVVTAHIACSTATEKPPRRRSPERAVTYPAVAVLVDDHYLGAPRAQLDAAVLVMDQVMPIRRPPSVPPFRPRAL